MHDELVDEGWHGAEPRPEVRDQFHEGDPGTEEGRVLVEAGSEAERAQQPEAEAGARADDQREQRLTLDVADEGMLDLCEQRR